MSSFQACCIGLLLEYLPWRLLNANLHPFQKFDIIIVKPSFSLSHYIAILLFLINYFLIPTSFLFKCISDSLYLESIWISFPSAQFFLLKTYFFPIYLTPSTHDLNFFLILTSYFYPLSLIPNLVHLDSI